MTTIKSYTDFSQSEKLAEILPLESADFHFSANQSPQGYLEKPIWGNPEYADYNAFPCWSLAALLAVLSFPVLRYDIEDGEGGWIVGCEKNDKGYLSYYRDNPVDTCYEMILKLHEQKLI